jgi:hypothetical protein
MMVLARRIELPLDMTIQGPHDTDPCKHLWSAGRRHKDQRFHSSLPLRGLVLGFRKLRDVVAGVLKRDEDGLPFRVSYTVRDHIARIGLNYAFGR